MQLARKGLSLALVLLGLALAPAARAQDTVDFEVLNGAGGAMGLPAQTRVIRTQNQLDQSGISGLVAPGQSVDFGHDMLIFALMGPQSSGGHGISVVEITRQGNRREVVLHRTHPGPGEFVTMAFTAPYTIVKLAKSNGQVTFKELPAFADFDSLRYSNASLTGGRSIEISASGEATAFK